MLRKAFEKIFLIGFLSSLIIPSAYAHCPVCTAAVGTGVIVTRFYGVDDLIVGLWIGAFIASTALWFGKKIKEGKTTSLEDAILIILALLITVNGFYLGGLMGHSMMFGIDRLLLGMILGSVLLPASIYLSKEIKKIKGKVILPYQTILVTLSILTTLSILLWLIL